MNVLLIEEDPTLKADLIQLIERTLEASTTESSSLQSAIELLEDPSEVIDLIICDYRGTGNALPRCMLKVSPDIPCFFVSQGSGVIASLIHEQALVRKKGFLLLVERADAVPQLEKMIQDLFGRGFFRDSKTPDSNYVRVGTEVMATAGPIKADIYVRLNSNRYCKLFRKGDQFDPGDLDRYLKKKGIQYFYLHKDQAHEIVDKQALKVAQASVDPINPQVAREVVSGSLEVIQGLTERLGFTPQAQALASKSVTLLVKMMAKSPSLVSILSGLKKNQGKYIASHSLMLAELACALASKIGWSSAPTVLKLTMASFLHDLTLKDNDLARYGRVTDMTKVGNFNSEDIRAVQLHPHDAAELARKFHEIPPDVDTIIIQHHEQPDGSGFPRGLFHNQISPLSTLFIVAHDLLDYSLAKGESAQISLFLAENKERYGVGVFKKIFHALEEGVPMKG